MGLPCMRSGLFQLFSAVNLDASLTGLGGAFGDFVYTLPIPKNFHDYSIVQLEILNIVVALKIWVSYGRIDVFAFTALTML